MIDEQRAAVEHLGALLRDDRIDLDSFEVAASRVLATTTPDELAIVVAALPGPVRMTPAHRLMTHPLRLETASGRIDMTSPWQVAEETSVLCKSGVVTLDLTMAEFDSDLIDLDLEVHSGRITVIVPPGVGVQMSEVSATSGRIRNELGSSVVVPGLPCLRISVSTRSGVITFRRPAPPKPSRRRWWHRLRRARDADES